MGGTDYVPKKDADFDGWFMNLITYVDTKTSGDTPAWPTIQPAAGNLIDTYPPWHQAFVKMQGPHTKVDTEAKNEMRAAAESLIRPYEAQYLHFPPVTDLDRTAMGIPNRSAHNTPKPAPADHVEFEFRLDAQSHGVEANFHIEGSEKRGKGPYHAAEIRYWILPLDAPAPIDAEEENWHSVADTASPWKHTFPGADAGKRLYVMMRWENSSTDDDAGKGPWSAIQGVVIP
jgi:hypothetical protein